MSEHAELHSNRASALDSDAESPTQDQVERAGSAGVDDAAHLILPSLALSPDCPDSADVSVNASHPGGRRQHGFGGGKKRSDKSRHGRVLVLMHKDEMTDIEVLGAAWEIPLSTLCWAVLHDWLQEQRGMEAKFGKVAARWRGLIAMALRDQELGPWLRERITDCSADSQS